MMRDAVAPGAASISSSRQSYLIAGARMFQRRPSIINSTMPLASGMWELEHLDDVFWIEGTPPVGLAIVLRPRDEESLKDDLLGFRQSGVDVLVSLLEPDEASWLGLRDEGPLAEAAGMHFLSYPIMDTHVPASAATFRAFVAGLADRLRAGQRIGVHCRGSIGRSTVTAACALIHLGWNAKEALRAIEAARGAEVPDTEEQLRWILKYKAQP
jgi:protein-tyrosine phosphatase